MVLRLIIYYTLLCNAFTESIKYGLNNWRQNPKNAKCLTGYMTELQKWVDEDGHLINIVAQSSIDLSFRKDAVASLQNEMSMIRFSNMRTVRFFSMAKCNLSHVPPVFHTEDNYGRRLADTAEYISFYGNNFAMVNTLNTQYDIMMNASQARTLYADDEFLREKMSTWSFGFQDVSFNRLRELDLRSCSIQVLGPMNFFNMPELNRLYLSENNIYYINANTFSNVNNLKHLDLSRNYRLDENGIYRRLALDTVNVFQGTKLESLDLSFTRLNERHIPAITRIGKSLQRLSICYSGVTKLHDHVFEGTSLRYLDISGNTEALAPKDVLNGLEDTLQVLYAEQVTLRGLRSLENFTKLEVLKVSYNNIQSLDKNEVMTLKNLQILDLDNNRLSAWNVPFVQYMPHLKLLSVRNNNINVISQEMFQDLRHISYVSLSGNFVVCNCYARDLFEVAIKNEWALNDTFIEEINIIGDTVLTHNGYSDYNQKIRNRNNISEFCIDCPTCDRDNNTKTGDYLILDYEETLYHCLNLPDSRSVRFIDVQTCNQMVRDLEINEAIQDGWNKLFLIIILPGIMLPTMLFIYVFRKNFKYFWITMKNSAMLSMISKNDSRDENSIYNYDVFVSYCNDDREWVLDHLLPHVEIDCNISVCLHERDFQVGLSILENIVSCMDRSRLIMLIVSQQFLLSQWCQFEMHLAQHRLLETRREDLIIILLEDIPRRLRPNTLHYLMVTKTYIVWPKAESEQTLFWKRMKKSLVTHKLKQTELNVSLA